LFSRINKSKNGNTKSHQDTVMIVAAALVRIFCPRALLAHHYSKTRRCAVQWAVSSVPQDSTAIVKVKQCNRPSQSADKGTVILQFDLHCSPSDTVPYRWRQNLLHCIHITLRADKQRDNIHNGIFNLCSKSQTCAIKHWRKGQWQVAVTLLCSKTQKRREIPVLIVASVYFWSMADRMRDVCIHQDNQVWHNQNQMMWCLPDTIAHPPYYTVAVHPSHPTNSNIEQGEKAGKSTALAWPLHHLYTKTYFCG